MISISKDRIPSENVTGHLVMKVQTASPIAHRSGHDARGNLSRFANRRFAITGSATVMPNGNALTSARFSLEQVVFVRAIR